VTASGAAVGESDRPWYARQRLADQDWEGEIRRSP